MQSYSRVEWKQNKDTSKLHSIVECHIQMLSHCILYYSTSICSYRQMIWKWMPCMFFARSPHRSCTTVSIRVCMFQITYIPIRYWWFSIPVERFKRISRDMRHKVTKHAGWTNRDKKHTVPEWCFHSQITITNLGWKLEPTGITITSTPEYIHAEENIIHKLRMKTRIKTEKWHRRTWSKHMTVAYISAD